MARSNTYRTTVSVLTQNKLGEHDLILTCITKQGAKLQAVAKGARKPSGKLTGSSQVLTIIDGLFAKGRSLDILCEAKVLLSSPQEMRDLRTNAALSLLIEVTRSLIFEDTNDSFIYQIFLEGTKQLVQHSVIKSGVDALIGSYIFKLFTHLGWRPQLEVCSVCHNQEVVAFSAKGGGVLCELCAETSDDAFYIGVEELALLRAFLLKRFSELATFSNGSAAKTCLHIACVWASTHGGMRLKTAEYYLAL